MDTQRLALSSRKWMAAAFAAWTDGPSSEDMAVHHAGVATEHLLKAFLVTLHPALIVDGRDFHSVLYATGHGALRQVRGSQVKTIQLGEAYDRAQKVLKGKLPALPPKGKPWPLADARNGVAHCGYHDRADVNAVFVGALTVIDPLLVELGMGDDYWGPHKELHDELLEEHVQASRVRVQGKLAKARRVFTERYGHIDEAQRAVAIALSRVAVPRHIEHGERAACPACSTAGWLEGVLFIDTDRGVVVLTPSTFQCAACDLRLEEEELDMVPVPLGRDIDLDMPAEEIFDGYDPDEVFDEDEPDVDAMVDAYMNR